VFAASLSPPILAAFVAAVCAAGGSAIAGHRWLTKCLIPLSGGLLILVAIGVLIPELAEEIGWLATLGLVAAGYALLMIADRYAFPICPSCDHAGGGTRLVAGFAAPLLVAVAIHAFVDGWGLVAVGKAAPAASRSVSTAILLHKIPEGLTLGALTRASFASAGTAVFWCVGAELATIVGGGVGLWLTPVRWISYALALAAGTFLFLGSGALRARWGSPHRN
jgi:zinc transporter ZupT